MFLLNNSFVDVADVLADAPRLVDPKSGTKFLAMCTYASEAALKEAVSKGVSVPWVPAPVDANKDRPASSLSTEERRSLIPHWWFAALVRTDDGSQLVHFDLCGPAFGNFDYLIASTGSAAPVHVFKTGVFDMTLWCEYEQEYPDKLWLSNRSVHVPSSMRHLACLRSDFRLLAGKVLPAVGVRPLSTLSRFSVDEAEVFTVRQILMQGVPAGVPVVLCNLKTDHLNGKSGKIHNNEHARGNGRVPVQLEGDTVPIKISTTSFRVISNLPLQYLHLDVMKDQAHALQEQRLGASWAAGTLVKIQLLKNATHLNGCEAEVLEFLHTSSRYRVQLTNGEIHAVRARNLLPIQKDDKKQLRWYNQPWRNMMRLWPVRWGVCWYGQPSPDSLTFPIWVSSHLWQRSLLLGLGDRLHGGMA